MFLLRIPKFHFFPVLIIRIGVPFLVTTYTFLLLFPSGRISGGSMNPARSFASTVVRCSWEKGWPTVHSLLEISLRVLGWSDSWKSVFHLDVWSVSSITQPIVAPHL